MHRLPHGRAQLRFVSAEFAVNHMINFRKIILAASLFLLVSLASNSHLFAVEPSAATEEIKNEDCFACHDAMSEQKFLTSVHGSNLCISCHSDIKEVPHPEKLKPVNCAECHHLESQIYQTSDHGIALKKGISAAACMDCHGSDPHAILDNRNPESSIYRVNIGKTCAKCHEDQARMEPYHLLEKSPLTTYEQSIHGKALLEKGMMQSAVCTDCHGSHDLHAPTNPKSKIYPQNVPHTCGKCHENVSIVYERSVHGKAAIAGKREAPVCTDCHGEHNIKSHLDPDSKVFASSVSTKVCGACHAAEKITSKYRLPSDRLKTYMESYHGLAGKAGSTTVASCASCHGAHDILPSSDPSSSVNKNNLQQTCGKCHPNVGEQLAQGSVHLAPSPTRDKVIFYVTNFYIALIVMTVGMMLVHNMLDFMRKSKIHYLKKLEQGTHIRFTRSERVQHLVLTFSFVVLAYSGFALKFSHSWWALPFTLFNSDYDLRGMVHKGAAIIFTALSVYHLGYLLFTARGRLQLQAFYFKAKDLADFTGMLKYNLGKAQSRPKFARYSYIEKIEYWALMWGAIIMIATGSMLTFENVVMQYLPKWILDVADIVHFYEAMLATLAIIVWHFYFTIFDPEHYPMNWSMTTGKSSEEDPEEPNSAGREV